MGLPDESRSPTESYQRLIALLVALQHAAIATLVESNRPDGTWLSLNEGAVTFALANDVISPGSAEILRLTLRTWYRQPPLARELFTAIVADITDLRHDAVRLREVAEHRRRALGGT
jgi:hypothetical protein